jgi:hypothetical protein
MSNLQPPTPERLREIEAQITDALWMLRLEPYGLNIGMRSAGFSVEFAAIVSAPNHETDFITVKRFYNVSHLDLDNEMALVVSKLKNIQSILKTRTATIY